MAKTATNRSMNVELDPIDRLEEKIKQLVRACFGFDALDHGHELLESSPRSRSIGSSSTVMLRFVAVLAIRVLTSLSLDRAVVAHERGKNRIEAVLHLGVG